MPELPEIETYARHLRPYLLGRRVSYLEALWPGSIAVPDAETLKALLTGQRIEAISRRGKFLSFSLDGGVLLIHLRMTGRFRVEAAASPRQPHDRVIMGLDDGRELRFNDTRKFGRFYFVPDAALVTANLGPEPLDETLTPAEFRERIRKRSGTVKPLLMNQTFLAGLGNIYTDEALFRARIHPLRKANTLTNEEITALFEAIRHVLQESIAYEGTSLDFVYTGGLREASAAYQSRLQVYGRAGEPCLRCGHILERIVVGGRGTHFCPQCQGDG